MTQVAERARNPYRALFATPGARAFSGAAFVGRMPMSMSGLAVVLLVSTVTGSYALAGSLSATFSVAYAAATPVAGRLTDRLGQHRTLVPQVLTSATATALFIVLAVTHAPVWTLFPVTFVMGAANPPLGGLVRTRWSHVLREEPARVPTAYAFESTADELIFVIGPVLVTMLSTQVYPAAGVAATALLTVSGGLAFAAQRSTEPVPRPAGSGTPGLALLVRGMPGLAMVFLLMGAAFGGTEVTMVAYAQEHGHRSVSGVILAVWAAGSGVAGLWYGTRNWRTSLRRRYVTALALFAAGMSVLPLIGSLPLMAVVIFLPGLATSCTLIPGFGLVEYLVPKERLTEGFGTGTTAMAIGIALVSPLEGRLIDSYGARVALVVPALALWAGFACSLAAWPRWRGNHQ